ncbi:MAG: fadD32, partial [Rhodococcus erythropolis]|nr:fadD32 [Rhodococcus erythropolis]
MVQFLDTRGQGVAIHLDCGHASHSQRAAIVDPETLTEVPDNHVGEIWLHGENIGIGYWGRPDETAEAFHNKLDNRLGEDSHTEGTPADANWMRTGDFGGYVDGELYITGRVKDLVIVDGRNHYPQRLEASAQEASPALRPGFIAAFAVPANQLPSVVFS